MGRKHSGENRFRFQTFTERIAAIRIGANVKTKRLEAIPEDAETFLGENLTRWQTLNSSNEFTAFESQIASLSQSLPLVYLHRQKIASIFKEHLKSATKLSLETTLDLLVHFARDLSSEFVPFSKELVGIIVDVSLANKQDPEVLECTFSCLAHIMKLLWKFFAEDLEDFLDIMMPTFGAKLPSYIRQFSAEAFAFLVRKSKDLMKTIRMIVIGKVEANPDCGYGLALVIFEVVKGANKTFLPCTEDVVKLLIELCSETDSAQVEFFQIFLGSCAEHTSVQASELIFKLLLKYLQSTAAAMSCSKVAHAQAFLSSWLGYRRGALCADSNTTAKAIVDSLAWHHSHGDECVDNLLSILSSIIELETNGLLAMQCYVHIKNLFDLPLDKAKLFDFALEHATSPLFASSFLPHILAFLTKLQEPVEISAALSPKKRKTPDEFDICEEPLDEFPEKPENESEDGSFVQDSLLSILLKLALKGDSTNVCLPDLIIKQFSRIVESKMAEGDLAQIWAIAVICQRFGILQSKRESATLLAKTFEKFCASAKAQILSNEKKPLSQLLITLTEIGNCFKPLGKTEFQNYLKLDLPDSLAILTKYPGSLLSLNLAKLIIDTFVDDEFQKDLKKNETLYSSLAELLQSNLASPIGEIREFSLHILERTSRAIYLNFKPTLLKSEEDFEAKSRRPVVNVIATLLAAERTEADLNFYKDRLNRLQRICADVVGPQPSLIDWQRLCVFHLTGQLAIDFAYLHKPIGEFLANYAENIPREHFWSVFSKLLADTHANAGQAPEIPFADESEEDPDEQEYNFEQAKSCQEIFEFSRHELKKKTIFHKWSTLRVRQWEALRLFKVDQLEPSSRFYIPVFLDFVSTSFDNILSSASLPLVNLLAKPAEVKMLKRRSLRSSGSGGEKRHCLVTMLNVVSKLKHRSQLASADKIVAAVFRLLKLPRPELQKPALEFLINTNWPGISTYKDILSNLLDDKKFRPSLVELSDLKTMTADDRKNVLPILLRLVFGQMHFVKNKNRNGKSGYVKKSASLAFLANISSEEIRQLIGIWLEAFQASPKWFSGVFEPSEAEFAQKALNEGIDPEAFPSTELQFWFFHSFTLLINNLPNVSASDWRLFFRIAVILYALTGTVLSKCDNNSLATSHEKRLRRLRKVAFKAFETFFQRRGDTVDDWQENCPEISAFFNHIIWPEFQRCGTLTSGSELLPLVSMASVWANDASMKFQLLLRKKSKNSDDTLLSVLFDSIKLTKASSASSTSIDLQISDAFMEFFEKLLPRPHADDQMELDLDEKNEQETFNNHVYDHRSVIIAMVSNLLNASRKNKLCRKRVPKALSIFHRVTAQVQDPTCAADVFQLLISMISSGSLPNGESVTSALRSIFEVIPVLESVSQAQMNMLALCFSRVTERQARNLLTQILTALAEKLFPSCQKVAKIVENMNAWGKKLDEPDYDRRLAAFSQSTQALKTEEELSVLDVTILLNNCLYFLLSLDDFSIRANSSELVTAIIQWAGRSSSEVTSSGRKMIVNGVVTACGHGIQHKNEVVRHEFLRILGQLARTFPDHTALIGLNQLTDDNDPDADFFENMRHVQHHRRGRAMRRLAGLLLKEDEKSNHIGLRPMTLFIMPLAQMYLLQAASGSVKSSMIDASLELLRACCKHLPWPTYYRLLSKFLSQLIAGNTEKINFNIRAVVAILDAYHFVSFASSFDANSTMEVDTVDPSEVIAPQKAEKEAPDSDVTVLKALKSQVLPNLIEAINAQLLPGSLASGQCAVIPLTIAAVRLLIHCPKAFRVATIPSIILKLLEFLKSRFLEVRQTARKSLGQICLALGPSQFSWIIRDLRSGLQRGYQRHVLTYTIGELVRIMQPTCKSGQLDACIKDLTTIFCTELFTVLSEEKEADCKVAGKGPEARRKASLHAYPILASLVSKASLDTYLHPLREVLLTSTDAEKVRKARQVLTSIVPILAQNPGISIQDLVGLARKWLHGSSKLIEAKQAKSKKHREVEKEEKLLEPRPQPSQLLPAKPTRQGLATPNMTASVNSYIISEFGLRLLFSLIKHNRLTDSSVSSAFDNNETELETFAGEIHALMRLGENESVLHAALQLASSLLTFKVPAFTSRLSTLADSVFELLKAELMQKNTQSRLLVACFKAAGTLVDLARCEDLATKKKRVGLDSEQIDALLICIDEALLGDRQGVCALQLLKKILDNALKSLQLAEILNGTVTKTALRGRDEHQPLARACILSYMLHYPHGQKSMESMLDVFLGVLTLENGDAGTLKSALEMLFLVASHFPEKELERRAAAIFLPIAALFVNAHELDVRELVNVALVKLLSRIPVSKRSMIFQDLVLAWLKSGKQLKQQLASHCIATFVEAEQSTFESRLAEVMPALVDIIYEKLESNPKNEPQTDEKDDENENPLLDAQFEAPLDDSLDGLIFSILVTLVKLLRQFHLTAITASSGGFSQLIKIATRLSLHPHSWIRGQIAFMWFEMFQAVELEDFLKAAQIKLGDELKLKTLCRRIINQLLTKGISSELSEKVALNCVFLSRVLIKTGNIELLAWFCRRVVRIAMAESIYESKYSCVKRLSVFKWMAAFVADLSTNPKLNSQAEDLVGILAYPLARELKETSAMPTSLQKNGDNDDDNNSEGKSGDDSEKEDYERVEREDPIAKELRPVCLELSDLFRKSFGVKMFTNAINVAMRKAAEKKLKRSAEKAALAVTDPARAARLKVYKQASKREARKRRITQDKTNRGAVVAKGKKSKRFDD